MRFYGFMFPGGMGGMGGMALNQLLVVMDGIDNPPFMRRVRRTGRTRCSTRASSCHAASRASRCGCRRRARARSRSTSSAPRTSRSTGSTPRWIRPGRMGRHVWFRTPTKHDRLDIIDLYINKVSHDPELDMPRRRDEIARDERLLAGDDRTGHVDGADDRAPLRSRALQLDDLVESITTLESAPRSASSTSIARAGRLRFTRRGTRSRGTLS